MLPTPAEGRGGGGGGGSHPNDASEMVDQPEGGAHALNPNRYAGITGIGLCSQFVICIHYLEKLWKYVYTQAYVHSNRDRNGHTNVYECMCKEVRLHAKYTYSRIYIHHTCI